MVGGHYFEYTPFGGKILFSRGPPEQVRMEKTFTTLKRKL